MGRVVSNMYGVCENNDHMRLEIISAGLYQLEIYFNTKFYEHLKNYRWCYESTKGLVYCTDLTMALSNKMGYKTPRVYLRDYIMFIEGHWENAKPNVIWHRPSLTEYRLDFTNRHPIKQLV